MKQLLVLFLIGVSCFLFACGKEMPPPQEMVEAASQGEKIQSLITALGGESQDARWGAVQALGKIGKPAVPALIEVLGSESVTVNSYAGMALGQIGEPAIPALLEALGDESLDVRNYALSALSQISTPEAVKAVEEYKNSLK